MKRLLSRPPKLSLPKQRTAEPPLPTVSASIDKRERAHYQQNLRWMQKELDDISQQPPTQICDVSKFGAAMERAETLEAQTAYHR